MKKVGILLSLLFVTSAAFAQSVCMNEAVTQTRAKIHDHYAKQGIGAKLSWIKNVDLGGIESNGPVMEDGQYESVTYTTYTIMGTMIFDKSGQFDDYAFYVRSNPETCQVLKVALLRTGASPFMVMTATAPAQDQGGALYSQKGKASKISTPQDGSPKIGYTFTSRGETSVQVENDMYLRLLKERAEQLVSRY